MRLKRDILRRSSLGVHVHGTVGRTERRRRNDAYGVDGTFAFFDNLAINTYWARTRTDGLTGEDTSYRAQMDYAGDRYGVQLERLVVGDDFNPEVGFVRRDDMRKNFGQFAVQPAAAVERSVRKFSWTGSMAYIENGAGRLETRDVDGEFAIEFQNSDRFSVAYGDIYEFLPQPFPIASGVTAARRGLRLRQRADRFHLGQQRRVSGNFSAEYGTFYSGHKTASASAGAA